MPAPDTMGKEKIIPILAFICLSIGALSSVYVYAQQHDIEYIQIHQRQFTIEEIFHSGEIKMIDSHRGVSLSSLIISEGIKQPEKHRYTLTALDGYQKTVQWENMLNGIITFEEKIIFSDLPQAYHIRDIRKIEVI